MGGESSVDCGERGGGGGGGCADPPALIHRRFARSVSALAAVKRWRRPSTSALSPRSLAASAAVRASAALRSSAQRRRRADRRPCRASVSASTVARRRVRSASAARLRRSALRLVSNSARRSFARSFSRSCWASKAATSALLAATREKGEGGPQDTEEDGALSAATRGEDTGQTEEETEGRGERVGGRSWDGRRPGGQPSHLSSEPCSASTAASSSLPCDGEGGRRDEGSGRRWEAARRASSSSSWRPRQRRAAMR